MPFHVSSGTELLLCCAKGGEDEQGQNEVFHGGSSSATSIPRDGILLDTVSFLEKLLAAEMAEKLCRVS